MNFRNETAVTQLSLDKSGERGRRLTNAVYAVAKRGFKTQGNKEILLDFTDYEREARDSTTE